MGNGPQLIIAGHSGTNILYRGPGTLAEWKEKLDTKGIRPTELSYYLTEMSRIGGPFPLLQIQTRGLLMMPHDGSYQPIGESRTLCPLDEESRKTLLHVIDTPQTPQGR